MSEIFNQIPDLMSSIEKAETCTEKIHVRRLGMDQASIEANYKTIQDSVSALNEEKVKLNDLIVQYIKGLVPGSIHGPQPAGLCDPSVPGYGFKGK